MPPPLQYLWIQSLLIGVVVSAIGIRNRTQPIFSAGLSAIVVVSIFVLNATVCGMLTLDPNPNFVNFVQRGLRGFAGSMLILIPLMPYFVLAPLAALITSALRAATTSSNMESIVRFPRQSKIYISTSGLIFAIAVIAIAFWQLVLFVRYDAF